MTIIKNYEHYDALDLIELIRTKAIQPNELLATAKHKAALINPKINAITTNMFDEAEAQLKVLDLDAPFAGLPMLLKDLGTMYRGVPTTNGSRFFESFMPQIDSEIVHRFRKAGCIMFGKTNVPEFGMSYVTESIFLGPCRNPWDLTKTPGGSSGGAAAAVAAGIIPVAHASDGGGSIRVPASCCGLFGLKPTRARVPCGPVTGEGWAGLTTSHVISKSVRDSAAMLDVLAGPELGDPYYAPAQTETFLTQMQQNPGRLKIAFSAQAPLGISVDPECITAVERAVKLCAELGHDVIEKNVSYDYEALDKAMDVIVAANLAFYLDTRANLLGRKPTQQDVELIHLMIAEQGKTFNASDYAKATFTIHNQTRQIAKFFIDYDIFITPTLAKPPVNIGELVADDTNIEDYYRKLPEFAPFTTIWNQTGQPAMSVPLHWTPDNLPVGVQFVARFGAENTLFQLARQLEQIAPWQNKLVAVHNKLITET